MVNELILEGKKNVEKLAGVMLIVDDKILLVKSTKNKILSDEWSIPKGKIDKGEDYIDCAFRELREETGIIINKDDVNYEQVRVFYKKNDIIKELKTLIIYLDKEKLNVKVKNDKINRKYYTTDEIYKAKFFDLEKARKKLQVGQRLLLKNI